MHAMTKNDVRRGQEPNADINIQFTSKHFRESIFLNLHTYLLASNLIVAIYSLILPPSSISPYAGLFKLHSHYFSFSNTSILLYATLLQASPLSLSWKSFTSFYM